MLFSVLMETTRAVSGKEFCPRTQAHVTDRPEVEESSIVVDAKCIFTQHTYAVCCTTLASTAVAGTFEHGDEEEEEIYEVINISKIKSHTPNLRIVNLYGISFIDDSHVELLSSNCIHLECVALNFCLNVKGASLRALVQRCKKLHTLLLQHCGEWGEGGGGGWGTSGGGGRGGRGAGGGGGGVMGGREGGGGEGAGRAGGREGMGERGRRKEEDWGRGETGCGGGENGEALNSIIANIRVVRRARPAGPADEGGGVGELARPRARPHLHRAVHRLPARRPAAHEQRLHLLGGRTLRVLQRQGEAHPATATGTAFVRRLKNLECALILVSEFKALKVLEFPKLA